ncbi:hypothetical protein [Aequorivita xiaoshiensis]|uniref:Uncharacterized protein n=1 Tax=Aequorivita xiaoshiensis TaxID=2874476 RepID=A0A9X1QY41_9FLAO|nr:hypothetical protein [Aequorivita xiaoshiensis]MCG2430761.1 hypothetical protein [Aequorivita xiaoshiensis]
MRKNNNIYKIIILMVIVSVLLYYFIGANLRQNSLKAENVNFTIAEIKDVEYGARVAPWFNFQFYANDNKIIEGKYHLSKNKQLSVQDYDSLKRYIGKKYIVKYSKKNPSFNEIYLQKQVPDSLYNCVGCQWDKMPY